MNLFYHYTAPLWKIFTGNLLLLACSLFYLAWWVTAFRPHSSAGVASGIYIMIAFITGTVSILMLSVGISALSQISKSVPVLFIVIGGGALFIVLLLVTSIIFDRPVTSELIIIHIWAALELSAVTVLYGAGRFGAVRAITLTALVCMATVIGLICYVLYYRLDETQSYWIGMVPLAVDSFVLTGFLGVMAVS